MAAQMAGESGNLAGVRAAFWPSSEVRQPQQCTQWYMIVVRPNHEMDAADSFRRQGIRCYWPNYERWVTTIDRRFGRRQRRVSFVAIVPGTLFSPSGEIGDLATVIERTLGALSIARTFSGHPIMLHEDDIQVIRKIEVGLNTPEPSAKMPHKFKVGDRVRFIDDDLNRWPPGKVERCGREGRMSVEVALMGRITTVVIYPHQIERV